MDTTRRLAVVFALLTAAAGAAPEDRFRGGGGDGAAAAHARGYLPPAGGAEARFTGGGGFDGHASARFAGYAPPAGGGAARFVGGGGFDGYAATFTRGFLPPGGGSLGRFAGGGHDGHATDLADRQPNPLRTDSDGDGIPDWWEAKFYLSLSVADAASDTDGDGDGALSEFLADTDPHDPRSVLAVASISRAAGLEIVFGPASVDRVYWVETSSLLEEGSWTPIGAPPTAGSGGTMTLGAGDPGAPTALFRIGARLPD